LHAHQHVDVARKTITPQTPTLHHILYLYPATLHKYFDSFTSSRHFLQLHAKTSRSEKKKFKKRTGDTHEKQKAMKAFLSIRALFLASTATLLVAAFSSSHLQTRNNFRCARGTLKPEKMFTLLFGTDNGSVDMGDDSAADNNTPDATVKCPDCDLCDGSGR
jgi:hypothetical protein